MAAQAPADQPGYVVRGRQVEVRQRAFAERLDRFHHALSGALQREAPELMSRLVSPPRRVFGYQILPRMVADAPPLTRSQLVTYSWRVSDTLIGRETSTLERLEMDLASVPPSPAAANRAALEALVAGYQTVIEHRRLIDADIDYNWLWQARIAGDRPLFDRLNTGLQAVLATRAKDAASAGPALETAAPVPGFDLPAFVGIDHAADHEWFVTVPLYTDITDVDFVQAFRMAVENVWHVRAGPDEFQVKLSVEMLSPERVYCGAPGNTNQLVPGCVVPAKGETVDLAAHVARFPKDAGVLTTGAASLQLTAGRAIVLGPHDVSPRVLAHELGHVLGLPDTYLRGYQDLGVDGFAVTELVADRADIMANPGSGSVQARHFEGLIVARDVRTDMAAGLAALYQGNDPADAVARFRSVLARNPLHYGATLQLAKALDRAGKNDEALAVWKKMLDMAKAAHDAETTRTVTSRLR